MSSDCVAALDAVDVSVVGHPALAGVSFCLRAGTLVVIGGPRGSGKSTLLRLLWGAVRPARGTVSAGGIDLTASTSGRLAAWRRQIGILSADFPLALDWTALDNLLAALNMQGPRVARNAADRAAHALGRWGLLPRRHTIVARLTDTERARLALARAFVRAPVAAFLDEPLSAVPEDEHAAVMGEIRLATRLGTAVLVTTCDRTQWSSVADEFLLLENGRLQGAPSIPAARIESPA